MYFPSLTFIIHISPVLRALLLRLGFGFASCISMQKSPDNFSAAKQCFCLSMKREIVSVSIFDIEVYVSGSFRGRTLLSGELSS